MKKYKIKEVFLTLQGEGFHSGRTAVFCRFSGCNFWTGRESDRDEAICNFCDTDFIGTDGINGGAYDVMDLVDKIESTWPKGKNMKFIVFTGGEPLLQLDDALIKALHEHNFEIAVESNGSIKAPEGIDWLCISPKSMDHFVQDQGNELKLVYPQKELKPSLFSGLKFDHFFLQPMDGPVLDQNTSAAIQYCLNNPIWKLSIQTHKILGID